MNTNTTQKKGIKKYFPFLTWLPIAKKTWKDDLIAGITGTIIVIPQAVAFALIAGLPPIYGFYTAMITPVIAALFGSSYHLISGPTTAISIVVFATISNFFPGETAINIETFVALTLVLTFMAGLMQFIMGLLRMGKLVNFVSHSVVIGFTAGAGILIAVKQMKHVFGIKMPTDTSFIDIFGHITANINETNWYAFAVAMGTLISAIITRFFLPKFYMLIAMVLGSVLAIVLGGSAHDIQLVGDIPSHLPPFQVPDFTYENVSGLASGALILAILGLIEAVAISRAIALHTHQKIDANQEFIGQGLSNMIASFFSSYAGSGSFTRSGVNHQAGAKTPLSAIFAAFFLMLVLLFFGKYASYLPKPAMGGIILLVGYNLIDFHHIKKVFKSSKRELIVLTITMLGTMFIAELEYALLAGMFFSFIFYMERTSNPHIATIGRVPSGAFINVIRNKEAKEHPHIKIVRIDGSMYFGAIESIADFFADLYKTDYKHVLIIASGINFIDLASAEWLEHEAAKWKKKGGGLYFSNLNKVAQDVLITGGFKEKIGEDNFFYTKKRAMDFLDKKFKT